MKLIYCPHCGDIVKLRGGLAFRFCYCTRSSGKYERNGLDARVRGSAIPLGILNEPFAAALKNRPKGDPEQHHSGERFTAFVIPEQAPTINYGGRTPRG